ncbi:lysis system i-spanin subunit Rz [Lysobacter enzymogenes]|uniref:lysis system i-spanin subunit Rz n=1 Tax=Lysobacter enzymogenes TaxID=69 RepID=UPI001114197E|nr:lysis system i-spanin subunit Rz [Lysobacter enzymogenes]
MTILARVLLAALVAMAVLALWQRGSLAKAERAQDIAQAAQRLAEAERDNANHLIAVERQRADKASAIAARFEQEKRDAESKGAAVAADLRAGNLRLQQRWAGCEARVPAAGAGSPEPDAAAADRAEGAADLVRVAAECDATVRGLQAQVTADRGQ